MTRRGARAIGALVAALAMVVTFSAAFGDALEIWDSNDAKGPLDAKLSVHGHFVMQAVPQELLRHALTTRSDWNPQTLANASTELVLYLDVDDDKEADRRVWVDVRRGSLYGSVESVNSGRIYGFARVWQGDAARWW